MGLYVKFRENLPAGFDWILDIQRNLHLRSEPVVFDVGANLGQTVKEIKQRLPNARLHAFEPVESSFAQLEVVASRFSSVTCHQLALGAAPSTERIKVVPLASRNSLVATTLVDDEKAIEQEIEISTVDDVCAKHQISAIDILKTDTEGYDLNVLRGAEGLLGRGAVNAVYVEVGFADAHPQCSAFQPIYDFLIERGFRFSGLYDLYWLQRKPWPEAWCNALFLREEIADQGLIP